MKFRPYNPACDSATVQQILSGNDLCSLHFDMATGRLAFIAEDRGRIYGIATGTVEQEDGQTIITIGPSYICRAYQGPDDDHGPDWLQSELQLAMKLWAQNHRAATHFRMDFIQAALPLFTTPPLDAPSVQFPVVEPQPTAYSFA